MRSDLNTFFVSCFYTILGAEERSLEAITNYKLSLKEIHVIEAVFKSLKSNENNFSTIAKLLNITLGTLTTAYAKLEKKGYLTKKQDTKDKRVYFIYPTRLAELINEEHTNFHERMIDGIIATLDPTEQANLTSALKKLENFFKELK